MLLSALYAILYSLLRTRLPRAPAARTLEVEVLVLRHEDRVLRRRWGPKTRLGKSRGR